MLEIRQAGGEEEEEEGEEGEKDQPGPGFGSVSTLNL